LRKPLREFLDWLAAWTLTPRGMALRMGVRAPDHAGPEPIRLGYRRAGAAPARMTPARARALAAAEGGLVHSRRALAEAAGCSPGVIDGLVDEGALEAVALAPEPVAPTPDPAHAPPTLEPAQAAAADDLRARVATRTFGVTLLEGVTGSGKTEVYFEAVAETLRQGRQVLILMPEIALTAQFLDRFAARFGARPAEWHSGVNPRKRARIWMGVAERDVACVVGARSALFLPFADLGLIVVDEEHEAAYKQDEGGAYQARDMAVMRGRFENAPPSCSPQRRRRSNRGSMRRAAATAICD
jgi:primosomal protein N' (replication factor Y)